MRNNSGVDIHTENRVSGAYKTLIPSVATLLRTTPLALAAAALLAGCAGGSSGSPPSATQRQSSPGGAGPRAARVGRGASTPGHARLERLLAAKLPVYCGGHRPYVALTFDDGPGVYTPLALRLLGSAHVRATFFLVGRNVGPYRRLAVGEERAGHALANHSFTHPVLSALSPAAIDLELSRTSAAIRTSTGVAPKLFRPPYGAHSSVVDATARRLGLLEVLWNVDSRDSAGANYASIARTVIAGIRPGAIILLHENRGQTIRALKFLILPALRRKRIHAVTLPDLLTLDPPSPAQLRAGPRGCGIGGRPTTR